MNNSINVNQFYNKSMILKPSELDNTTFDLSYYVYNGKLTSIADHFNCIQEKNCKEIVKSHRNKNNEDKTALHIAAFLNFSNVFVYLLTYDANPYAFDFNGQSVWHTICYKGHSKLLCLLFNYECFKIKMQSLNTIDDIKKTFGFSKLDIIKGKLSKAVNMNEINRKKFEIFQEKIREEAYCMIKKMLEKFNLAFSSKDKEGRNPLHYAAMSKYSLCHVTFSEILSFDFFKMSGWDEFVAVYQDIQNLEIKEERIIDSRRSARLDKELTNILGDDFMGAICKEFKISKSSLIKKIINSEDNSGDSVLHLASFHGDYRIVNKLLLYGADKNLTNVERKMPVDMAKDDLVRKVLTNLNKAAKSSDEKNIVELVHFGHDVNEKSSIFSQAPIHKIIESKSTDKFTVLTKLLDIGADPNIKDSNAWSALHYSCQLGDLESAKILIKNNAEINSFSNNSRTPLHLASSMNFPALVNFLLENKSYPNHKDNLGCTPLHLAGKHGNVECISILLKYGAKLYEEDFRKWNVLHYAAFNGHKKTIRFLCKYDADYDILQNSKNSQNKLPIEVVRDLSMKPYFISLWHAAREGNLDMTRQLLNDGENINDLTTFMKNSPLHLAVLNNNYLLVRLLITNNAVMDMRNKDGITAGEYAEIVNIGIRKFYNRCDETNKKVDLKLFVKNALNKNDKILDCVISQKNKNSSVWNVYDFSEKICKAFKLINESVKD